MPEEDQIDLSGLYSELGPVELAQCKEYLDRYCGVIVRIAARRAQEVESDPDRVKQENLPPEASNPFKRTCNLGPGGLCGFGRWDARDASNNSPTEPSLIRERSRL